MVIIKTEDESGMERKDEQKTRINKKKNQRHENLE